VVTRLLAISVITLAGTASLLAAGPGSTGNERNNADEDVHESATVHNPGRPGDILSLQQILQYAWQQHAGRVLEAELEEHNGRIYYEVEILDVHGEVWEMNFDARSGELLGAELED
jgi:uncharacterized membrane protein YkoI